MALAAHQPMTFIKKKKSKWPKSGKSGKVASGANKKLARKTGEGSFGDSQFAFFRELGENRVKMPHPLENTPSISFQHAVQCVAPPLQLPFECQMSFVPSSAILHFQLAPFHNFRVNLFFFGG